MGQASCSPHPRHLCLVLHLSDHTSSSQLCTGLGSLGTHGLCAAAMELSSEKDEARTLKSEQLGVLELTQ